MHSSLHMWQCLLSLGKSPSWTKVSFNTNRQTNRQTNKEVYVCKRACGYAFLICAPTCMCAKPLFSCKARRPQARLFPGVQQCCVRLGGAMTSHNKTSFFSDADAQAGPPHRDVWPPKRSVCTCAGCCKCNDLRTMTRPCYFRQPRS